MATRDEFGLDARRQLAARVGHRCSNPTCGARTAGPALDGARSISVGVAAHITAAAAGGPRFDASLSTIERAAIANGIWLCQTCSRLIDADPVRFTAAELRKWKQHSEEQAELLVGRPESHPVLEVPGEAEVLRKLGLRDELRRALLRSVEERRGGREYHPYSKFRCGAVVIRSLTDVAYPNVDETPGISSWFRVETFDFYHNGLEVILGICRCAIDNDGRWRPLRFDEQYDSTRFREIKMWEIGCIPYRNMRVVDKVGDEFYREPHIYCVYADNGEPYEEVRYSVVAENDDYDFPLNPAMRIADK